MLRGPTCQGARDATSSGHLGTSMGANRYLRGLLPLTRVSK
jgi:hypothetical protein